MDNILVTGGAGYVGSHVCKALAAAGYRPVVYDNLRHGHREAVRWGPLEVGEVEDQARLGEVIERYRPVGALHFAALIQVGESVTDPAKYYRNNAAGTLSLLEGLRAGGVQRLVFSSTAAVYGTPDRTPIDEDHPLRPINPYGATKLAVEWMLRDFGVAYGLGWAALRYFNAAGADPEGETGERHDPESHAIPLAIQAAMGTGPAFNLYGTDYPTADGTAVRDYIHVADLASAHVLALRRLLDGGDSQALNLGTGIGTSVRELLESVGRVGGRPVPVIERPRRAGDPPVLLADPGRAARVLGWAAAYRQIDDIVRTAWAWHARG